MIALRDMEQEKKAERIAELAPHKPIKGGGPGSELDDRGIMERIVMAVAGGR